MWPIPGIRNGLERDKLEAGCRVYGMWPQPHRNTWFKSTIGLAVEYTALERPVAAGWLPRRAPYPGVLRGRSHKQRTILYRTCSFPCDGEVLERPTKEFRKPPKGSFSSFNGCLGYGSESHGTDGGKTFNRCGFFKGFRKKNPSSGCLVSIIRRGANGFS
ncbi:forkhead-associated domain-containing protein 1 [Anopheles sinensis]|uniref:Forkhead-associated domain-containing protein 1 n=1 Tax=Anopheles sinensis TaxID=74873 RepID=A0A084WUW7_ANOSI|nr:forkhead-associated domain-containing protein 1 [Anopheles sinensis]